MAGFKRARLPFAGAAILSGIAGALGGAADLRDEERKAQRAEDQAAQAWQRQVQQSDTQWQRQQDEKKATQVENEKQNNRTALLNNAKGFMQSQPEKAMVMLQQLQAQYPEDREVAQLYPQAEQLAAEKKKERDDDITASTLYRHSKDPANEKLAKESRKALDALAAAGNKSAMTYIERIEADEQHEKDVERTQTRNAENQEKVAGEAAAVNEFQGKLSQVAAITDEPTKAAKLMQLYGEAQIKGLKGMGTSARAVFDQIEGEVKLRESESAPAGSVGKGKERAYPEGVTNYSGPHATAWGDSALASLQPKTPAGAAPGAAGPPNEQEQGAAVELAKQGWRPDAVQAAAQAATGIAPAPLFEQGKATDVVPTPAPRVPSVAPAPAPPPAPSVQPNPLADAEASFKEQHPGPLADQALAQAKKTVPGTDPQSLQQMLDTAAQIYQQLSSGQAGGLR